MKIYSNSYKWLHYFVFIFSDSPPHLKNYTITEEAILKLLNNMTQLIEDEFPDIPIYPLFGNHDMFGVNQLPPRECNIYANLSIEWAQWLDPDGNQSHVIKTFKKGTHLVIFFIDFITF